MNSEFPEISGNVIPVTVVIDPSNPPQGSQVQVIVTTNKPPQTQETVYISSTPTDAFLDLPSNVTVASPENYVIFKATLDPNAAGPILVTAACNGGMAAGSCLPEIV